MMKKRYFVAILITVFQVIYAIPLMTFAEERTNEVQLENTLSNEGTVLLGIDYLKENQQEDGKWEEYGKTQTSDIVNILEYILDKYPEQSNLSSLIENGENYIFSEEPVNVDELSRYFLIDNLRETWYVNYFLELQNKDGGFGLSENYASDIIDTKIALKTLADLGETESMINAALYIASLQNADGGFSYQEGLDSNPELTAEIADIFADCTLKENCLKDALAETLAKLNEYLEQNALSINELSEENLPEVYQHFHTALFKLKTTGKYDVTPYYELQNEEGSVFDDSMATALFLELIICEQNSIVANLENISITNEKGYTVSSFNANENVIIQIESEYETEKAYLLVTIETPSGKTISIDSEDMVWNTGNYGEGTYTVRAEIIGSSNCEVVAVMTQNFRIEHKLSIDNISLSLSQSFSRVGDEEAVSVYADVSLQNFSEESDTVSICWKIECNDEQVFLGNNEITEADLIAEAIYLGDFTPDTSERKTYIITAEVVSNDFVVAQATANYFISDKSVAIVTDVNKEYLYEAADEAEIAIKIRDERVIDLIFTTSSDDTELIKQYADKMEEIKKQLESQGYLVNLCSVETSYLTAKDTFAWVEYDHPNYDTQSPYTKHIVYEEDNIVMKGYTSVPYKDFLVVPDASDSQKLFTFDIQRDKTDWHSMNGGGFLFNTVIEEDIISG